MQCPKMYLKLGCVVVILASASVSALGGGFDLPDQDAFAIGRGMAFVATADNPSAIYFNPAGITQLQGNNFRSGIYGVDLNFSYKSPSGTTYHNQDTLHAIPQFFYTYSLEKMPLSFGLGVYSPYGLGNQWPQDTGFRTLGTKSSITYATINPVIAWQIIPSLSIGVGLTVNDADLDLQQGLFWPTQPNDGFKFEGNGWAVGYNAGVLWKPIDEISFGALFAARPRLISMGAREPITMSPRRVRPSLKPFRLSFFVGSGAHATFPFPLNTIVGVSYRPTPHWNIEFDAEYTDWNSLNTVTVNQSTPAPILPANIPLTLDWQSSWYYEKLRCNSIF